jgi:hypothetical protein
VTYLPLASAGVKDGILLGSLQRDFPTVTDSVLLAPCRNTTAQDCP